MSELGTKTSDDQRVEELLRVNAALAAEIRSLLAGRIDAPRSAPMPTSRRIAALLQELDAATADLEAATAELAAVRDRLAVREREREALVSQREQLTSQRDLLQIEVARLRGGLRGALRRVRARLLRH